MIATWLFADGETVTEGAALAEVMYEKASKRQAGDSRAGGNAGTAR